MLNPESLASPTVTQRATYDRLVVAGLIALSALALGFLTYLLLAPPMQSSNATWTAGLPTVNATLNTLTVLLLVAGYIAIRNQRRILHAWLMRSAFVVSALFFVSYSIYHSVHGDTPFTGQGWIRLFYFTILISHIVLSVVIVPLVLCTLYFAFRERWPTHRKLARITLPLWLYVSITGVMIYLLLALFK